MITLPLVHTSYSRTRALLTRRSIALDRRIYNPPVNSFASALYFHFPEFSGVTNSSMSLHVAASRIKLLSLASSAILASAANRGLEPNRIEPLGWRRPPPGVPRLASHLNRVDHWRFDIDHGFSSHQFDNSSFGYAKPAII